jgi:hypothetical protein
MSRRGEREATPVILVCEGYDRYSVSSSMLHPKVYDRGAEMKQVDGGYYLTEPAVYAEDACAKFFLPEQVRELARGRSTMVGNTTITHDSRTVYDHMWRVIPVTGSLPVEDYHHRAAGPAVLIPGVGMRLRDTLWTRAWEPGGIPEPGQGNGSPDDDGGGGGSRGPRWPRRPASRNPSSSPTPSERTRRMRYLGDTDDGPRGRIS